MKYGERLNKARKAKNLTQDELADKSGVPQGTISKIERGDQDSSTYDTLLAYALSVPSIWLTKGQGEMSFFDEKEGVKQENAPYSKEAYERLNRIEKLSPADQARLDSIIDALDSHMDNKPTGSE